MKTIRHTFSRCLMFTGLLLGALAAQAQAFPDKPITLVVGFPPGGGVDITARQIAGGLSKELGQQVVVENRAGAAGNIAMSQVARARPDGYVLLVGNLGMLSANPFLYSKLSFDATKSFSPIARLVAVPLIAATPAGAPAKDLKGFIDQGKARPGELFFGSGGSGNINHLAGELLKQQTGASLVHVPFQGSAPALNALIANQVQLVIDGANLLQPQLAGGRIHALATTGEKRLASLPDVPTMAEVGLPGMTIYGWQGLLAPTGTPPEVIEKLSKAVEKVLADPAVKAKFAEQGADVAYQPPAAFADYIAAEQKRWRTVIQSAGIKVE
ncbi:MAG: tripartite tricarboxylate transporter substrate binding protein [Haliea sp.]|nr:MAG: tripartite tricarboxylate transporter substrate binding protein [Haliea sp.]